MFCPQRNVEYRPGFTRCSDCDVDLVQDPPHFVLAGNLPVEPGDRNEDPFCSFWKGEDPRIHAELCKVLEEACIPHKTVFRRDHLFNFHNYPRYEIGVPFSLYERAEAAVKKAFGEGDVEDSGRQELQELFKGIPSRLLQQGKELSPADLENLPGPPTTDENADWFPEDATANVWSTESNEPSEFLVAALHENGIHCRVDQQGTCAKLYVLPHDATRAREILREIGEGSPPL